MSEFPKYDPSDEIKSFDRQVRERISLGYVPDLRNLQTVEGLYNNPWREPEFVNIQITRIDGFILSGAI